MYSDTLPTAVSGAESNIISQMINKTELSSPLLDDCIMCVCKHVHALPAVWSS